MLATILDYTWNVLNMRQWPQIWKDRIIQTSPVAAIKRLKDLPTWLMLATNLQKPQPPSNNKVSDLFSKYIGDSSNYLHPDAAVFYCT